MDRKEEYHDPDYPEASTGARQDTKSASEEDKVEKIRRIVRREFSNELEAREHDIMMLDQRSLLARRMLHRLRYALVNNYYNEERLKLTNAQIQDEIAAQTEPRAQAAVSSILRESQRRLPPSVRKLLGKQSSAVELHDILLARRAPRQQARKDYSAMVQPRKSEANTSCTATNPEQTGPNGPVSGTNGPGTNGPAPATGPVVKPRRLQPPETQVLTVNAATRNQTKHRYRIIIGNTSKYAPPASAVDKSTHKWLLYVRGGASSPALGVVSAVTVRLHHSYAPHHTLHLQKPPFHVSRRGWGEFPAKIELHFPLPERNRPVTVEHTIKLDRNYTGFQTLGAETVVDVWLYSTEEMLQYEYKEDDDVIKPDTKPNETLVSSTDTLLEPKQERTEIDNSIFETADNNHTDSWLDFFTNTTELDVDEMFVKPEKKIEVQHDLDSIIETNIIQKDRSKDLDATLELRQEIVETEIGYDDNDSGTQNSIDVNSANVNCKRVPIVDMPSELLTQPTSPKKRIMKYMDPTTGKIYYLEMDRKLDLSKVQEIVINSKGNVKTAKISPIKPNGLKNVRKTTKKGVSLLKPELKSLLKTETVKNQNVPPKIVPKKTFSHIENDHCYFGPAPFREPEHSNILNLPIYYEEETTVKKEESVYNSVISAVQRLNSVKVAVDWCLKKVPLISSEARDPDFVKHFPFVVEKEERYWKLDFAKRRNLEWSRAKFINKLLTEHLNTTEPIWRTKQILIYSRMHGYHPVRPETVEKPTMNEYDWSSWTDFDKRKAQSELKLSYPNVSDICTLTKFNESQFSQSLSDSLTEITDSDEEVEIVKWDEPVKIKKQVLPDSTIDLPVLPVLNQEERLRFLFVEKKCADIGIELRNEDVGSGYSYSCVHAVLLSAMKSFAEELIRAALAAKSVSGSSEDGLGAPAVWSRSTSRRASISLADVWGALQGASTGGHSRLHVLSARGLGSDTRADEFL